MTKATISVRDLAAGFEVTEQRVRQLVQEGFIPRAARGVYELWPAVRGYLRYWRERASAHPRDDSIGGHKTRLVKAQADQQEIAAELQRGTVLALHPLMVLNANCLVRWRTKCLAIGVKAAPLVADETDPAKCQAIIDKIVHEALAELAATTPADVGIAPDGSVSPIVDGAVAAAAETDGEPVGGPEAPAERRVKRRAGPVDDEPERA